MKKGQKKKGRFVLEAAVLVPWICILLVYLVYFTLYAHDCAVCMHTALEAGAKGIYREEKTSQAMEQIICQDLEEKLPARLLWVRDPQIQVKVTAVKAVIEIKGQGAFLQGCQVEISQDLYRVRPCTTIRRSRWLTGRKTA